MIIQYDTRPDATTDEKLRSLIKSIQLALGEIESSTGGGSSSQPTDISSIIASLRELSDEMAAAADAITGLDDRVTELEEDAGVVDAYPISGATPLSASWLSDTSGGSALTPEANHIYILMSDSGDYTANALFRWNGTAYVPLTSGGSVTSTSVPTANTISEFDSDAHMNSEDMTAQEVQDFVDNLDVSGGGVTVVQDIQTVFFADSSQTISGGGAVTREGLSIASVVPSGYTPIFASFRFAGNYLTVCYTCTLSNTGLLTYQIANRSSSSITVTPQFQILCVKKTQ